VIHHMTSTAPANIYYEHSHTLSESIIIGSHHSSVFLVDYLCLSAARQACVGSEIQYGNNPEDKGFRLAPIRADIQPPPAPWLTRGIHVSIGAVFQGNWTCRVTWLGRQVYSRQFLRRYLDFLTAIPHATCFFSSNIMHS
jgi:hypothetical protein